MNQGREEIPAAMSRREQSELYQRYHGELQRAITNAVGAPRELIEDACQHAWTMLLRAKPDRTAIFDWLFGVATREARRLWRAEGRYTHLEAVRPAGAYEAALADNFCFEDFLEAREALAILASLPDRERDDLTLVVAGFSYDEIGEMTGGRTFSSVRRHVERARARIRLARLQ